MKNSLTRSRKGVYSRAVKDAIYKRQCLRCGHIWFPRSADLPMSCPNRPCRSPYWNRPRTRKATVQAIRAIQDESKTRKVS